MEETQKDFIIKKEDIECYGDDERAIIRAFCERIAELETDKENLEYVINEINFILQYEL